MNRPILALATATALALAGCNGDGTGPGNGNGNGNGGAGTFQATVSGDLATTFSGTARFIELPIGSGATTFALTLEPTAGAEDGTTLSVTRVAARPGVGTHSLARDPDDPTQFLVIFTYHTESGFAGALTNVSGQLQITRSAASRLTGSLETVAEGILVLDGEATEVTATISATFDAVVD